VSQPPPYTPSHAFLADAATLGNFPGQALDVEFNNIAAVTGDIEANLALIQRDDGALANGSVTYDQLSPALQVGGIAPAAPWSTATSYGVSAYVVINGNLYRALRAHTSGVFATDLAAGDWLFISSLIAVPQGAVCMYPPASGSGNWICLAPNGAAISTVGSTTQGLQESLNHALANGFPFRAYGTGLGTSGSGGAVINCSTPVILPPIQIGDIRFYDITINFGAAIGGASAFVFDSAEILYFELNGQIVSQGSGAGVEVNPVNSVVLDGFVAFTQNVMYIKAIAMNGNASTAIAMKFSPRTGPISQNIITLGEFAGGGQTVNAGCGVQVTSPVGGNVFEQNLLKIGAVHGFGVDTTHGAIQVGTSASNQANIRGNQWEVGCIRPVNSAHGFSTWGAFDRFTGSVTNQEGAVTDAIHLNAGASNNTLNAVHTTGMSDAVFNDQSGNTTNAFYGVAAVAGQAGGAVAIVPQVVGTFSGAGAVSAILSRAAGQASVGWWNTSGGADAKVWDAVVQGTTLQFRAVNDANSVANAFLQATRSGATISAVQVGDGTHFLSFPIGANDTAASGTNTLTLTGKSMSGAANTFTNIPISTAISGLGAGVATVLGAGAGAATGVATLDGGGKLASAQIPASLVGALQYQGTWNATTNSPALVSSTGTKGQYYKVSVAGTTTIDGVSQWNVNDQIVFDGATWDKIDGISSEVVTVAGRFGAVVLARADITDWGANIAAALGIAVGSAGAPVVNGGALGSPSSVGTIPAHTLGGTVSGGGNQINNVVIGASTPLAGTFTTLIGQAGNSTSSIPHAGLLGRNVTPTGNGADTTEDILQSFTLPAGALATVGQKIKIKACGTYGANADNKTIKVCFGAQIYNTGIIAQSGTAWGIELEVWKTGPSTQAYYTSGLYCGSSLVGTGGGTLTQTDTGAITIKITGQAGTANANDIVCSGMFVEFCN
jgi:hypothetical protein